MYNIGIGEGVTVQMASKEIKLWIDSTFSACALTQQTDSSTITFVTSMGFITGKKAVISSLDFSTEEGRQESIRNVTDASGRIEIDAISIAHALARGEVDELIHLEGAIIYMHQNLSMPLPVDKVTLNPEQIIAVIPGKFEARHE